MMKISNLRRKLQRFRHQEDGVAAIEFALIAPFMIFLLLAYLELTDVLTANRQVNNAANMLADLTTQEIELSPGEAKDIFTAVERVIKPYGVENAEMKIYALRLNPSNDAEMLIEWSVDNKGKIELPEGDEAKFTGLKTDKELSSGQKTLLTTGHGLMVAEIKYPYQSSVGANYLPKLNFNEEAVRWPRRTKDIIFCRDDGTCSDDDTFEEGTAFTPDVSEGGDDDDSGGGGDDGDEDDEDVS